MYNKALSLYLLPPYEQFTAFFSQFKQDFSLMLFYMVYMFVITFTFSGAIFQKWSWPLVKLSQPL